MLVVFLLTLSSSLGKLMIQFRSAAIQLPLHERMQILIVWHGLRAWQQKPVQEHTVQHRHECFLAPQFKVALGGKSAKVRVHLIAPIHPTHVALIMYQAERIGTGMPGDWNPLVDELQLP
jgi:hypothetical protein